MSMTKEEEFISNPLDEKTVYEVPGIGPVRGNRMKEKGCKYAYQILGQYLILRRNEDNFKEWLKFQTQNIKTETKCLLAIQKWLANYIENIVQLSSSEDSIFSESFKVLEIYLKLIKTEENFKISLKKSICANDVESEDCFNVLHDWWLQHLEFKMTTDACLFRPSEDKSVSKILGIEKKEKKLKENEYKYADKISKLFKQNKYDFQKRLEDFVQEDSVIIDNKVKIKTSDPDDSNTEASDGKAPNVIYTLENYLTLIKNKTELEISLKEFINVNEMESEYCFNVLEKWRLDQLKMTTDDFLFRPFEGKSVSETHDIGKKEEELEKETSETTDPRNVVEDIN